MIFNVFRPQVKRKGISNSSSNYIADGPCLSVNSWLTTFDFTKIFGGPSTLKFVQTIKFLKTVRNFCVTFDFTYHTKINLYCCMSKSKQNLETVWTFRNSCMSDRMHLLRIWRICVPRKGGKCRQLVLSRTVVEKISINGVFLQYE